MVSFSSEGRIKSEGSFLLILVMNAISLAFSYMNILIGGGKHIKHFVLLSYDSVCIIVRHKLTEIFMT